jgi:hypothetical protein
MLTRTRSAVGGLTLALCLLASPVLAAENPVPGADTVPEGTHVTLTGRLPLSAALAELRKQTGFEIADRSGASDRKVEVALEGVTFWEALEAVAREADCRVLPDAGGRQVALVKGPHRPLPLSFSGPYRTAVKRTTAARDLETGAHSYLATLEVAWEPGVTPLFLERPPLGLAAEDERGRPVKVDGEGGGRVPVEGHAAVVTLHLPELGRATERLGLLKGTVHLVGPSRWLTFTFDDLARSAADPRATRQTQDGVRAELSKVTLGRDRWGVEVSLAYPEGGPELESFEVGAFVAPMQSFLKTGDRLVPCGPAKTESGVGTRVSVLYELGVGGRKDVIPADARAGDWGVVFKAPGPLRRIPVPFEFHDVRLP